MICCPKYGEIKKDDIYGVDRDELDEAYHQGELSTEQYERALREGEAILAELCSDIVKTEAWCSEVLTYMNERISQGEVPFEKKNSKIMRKRRWT